MTLLTHFFVAAISFFVIRNFLRRSSQLKHVAAEPVSLTKIGTEIVAIFFLLQILGGPTRTFLILMIPICEIVVSTTQFVLIFRKDQRFESDFRQFLATSLVFLRAGFSQQHSFYESLEQMNPKNRQRTQNIIAAAEFYRSGTPPAAISDLNLVAQLIRLNQNGYRFAERLQEWLQHWSSMSEFRQKSSHVLWQSRFQAVVMTVLYLALSAAMSLSTGNWQWNHLQTLSFVLFATGTVWMWRMGRKIRWTF